MLVDTSIQGLNHSYKKALPMKSPTTLEQGGKIKLEFSDDGPVASSLSPDISISEENT
mgnify:CR=1 FL=1